MSGYCGGGGDGGLRARGGAASMGSTVCAPALL